MAVTPLGNIIQINQNTHVAGNKAANFINRIDIQDLAAKEIAKDDKKDVEEVRPTEESEKVNEDKEHEKQQAKDERDRPDKEEDEDKDEGGADEEGHIDITV